MIMSYYSYHVDKATNAILDLIRSWEDYEQFTNVICDALEIAANQLIADKERRAAELNGSDADQLVVEKEERRPPRPASTPDDYSVFEDDGKFFTVNHRYSVTNGNYPTLEAAWEAIERNCAREAEQDAASLGVDSEGAPF
jgi:hypothetical protein